jgi:two-component system, LytTR family, sensor histidine kinase AlgZ
MHPILARPWRLAVYIAIWIPLGVLLAALLALQGALGWTDALLAAVPLSIAYGFLCLSAWYVTRGSPVDRLGAMRVAASAIASAFLSSAIWLLLARGWMGLIVSLARREDVQGSFRTGAPTLFGFGFLLYLLAMAVSYLAAAFAVSRDAERRGLELQVQAREAELRALRAQIDPHFLFNSLQSISALTTADPAAARRMCLLLGDFLRDTLALGSQARIPLASELALARRFLAIEQVRFGDRLRVDVTAPADAEACDVPPLLLQPLVENAVTHGVAHVLEGGTVTIRAERRPVSLLVVVESPCDADRPAGRGTGLGLRNVRARLQSEYGDDAVLQAGESNGGFVARIELPLADSRPPVAERREQDPIDRELEEAKWELIAAHRALQGPGGAETRRMLEAAEREIEAARRARTAERRGGGDTGT